jgi:hypothetical protein
MDPDSSFKIRLPVRRAYDSMAEADQRQPSWRAVATGPMVKCVIRCFPIWRYRGATYEPETVLLGVEVITESASPSRDEFDVVAPVAIKISDPRQRRHAIPVKPGTFRAVGSQLNIVSECALVDPQSVWPAVAVEVATVLPKIVLLRARN